MPLCIVRMVKSRWISFLIHDSTHWRNKNCIQNFNLKILKRPIYSREYNINTDLRKVGVKMCSGFSWLWFGNLLGYLNTKVNSEFHMNHVSCWQFVNH